MKKVKFIKKANLWASIKIKREKGKLKQEIKWFTTKEKAEADNKLNI